MRKSSMILRNGLDYSDWAARESFKYNLAGLLSELEGKPDEAIIIGRLIVEVAGREFAEKIVDGIIDARLEGSK